MKSYEMDLCHGPLFSKIVLFSLPLLATYILQLLFNAADLVVIGHYSEHTAMAAIGSTMNMNSLVVSVFAGLSVGTNVIAARCYGAKDREGMDQAVHTSVALALWGGVILMIVALLAAKPLLVLMKTPEEVLLLSCRYIWICFLAIPFMMLYNFGCSILRAVGDTRRPLFYLVTAGIVNVVLNLIFVIGFHMGVEGVAIATASSHGIAALLLFRTLMQGSESFRLELKKLKIHWKVMKEILIIGVPASLQSSCFAVSNMMIQSSVNSFGSVAMAGNAAAICVEGIVYIGSFAFHHTAICFVSQNLGGQKYKRIIRSLYGCFICTIIACLIMGWGFYLAGRPVLSLINPDPEVVEWGLIRIRILLSTYIFCGIMDVASGGLRGLGWSLTSTINSLSGACLFRILWVMLVLPHHNTMEMLMISYPVSWILVASVGILLLFIAYRRVLQKKCAIRPPWLGVTPGLVRGFRWMVKPK